MPSADELRARIAQISDSIEGHKQAIRDLEIQQRALKSDLNVILDPMARLPFEMVSDVFLHSAPTADAASVLLAVCRSWSNIALATPLLWTTISNVGVTDAARFANLLELWFDRGRNLPVSLSLGPWTVTLNTIDRVTSRLYRLQKLDINVPEDGDLGYVPHLHRLVLHSLTHLTVRTMVNIEVDLNGPEDLLGIMRHAPNLLEFDMYEARYDLGFDGVLTHTSLQHLRLGKFLDSDPFLFKTSPTMLSHLTFPSLQTLHFFSAVETTNDVEMLLGFLTRSSPPLRSLQFGSALANQHGHITLACLQLIPTLTSLRVWCIAPHLIEMMIDAPDLLPALREFEIRGEIGNRFEFQYLLSILTRRRATLRCFRLLVIYEAEQGFDGFEQTANAFRQLAEDSGMRIQIGTPVMDLLNV